MSEQCKFFEYLNESGLVSPISFSELEDRGLNIEGVLRDFEQWNTRTPAWQSISEAPKDGKPFLAITKSGENCVMYWNGEEVVRSVTCRRCGGLGLDNLTHWQPLPAPPTEAGQ